MFIKKGWSIIVVLFWIFVTYGASSEPLGQIPHQVIDGCVKYYKETAVSPDVAFEFCGTSAGTEDRFKVKDCITYYRKASVSADVAFGFCSKSAGTENSLKLKNCISFFKKEGVSPDNAFKTCVNEIKKF